MRCFHVGFQRVDGGLISWFCCAFETACCSLPAGQMARSWAAAPCCSCSRTRRTTLTTMCWLCSPRVSDGSCEGCAALCMHLPVAAQNVIVSLLAEQHKVHWSGTQIFSVGGVAEQQTFVHHSSSGGKLTRA